MKMLMILQFNFAGNFMKESDLLVLGLSPLSLSQSLLSLAKSIIIIHFLLAAN